MASPNSGELFKGGVHSVMGGLAAAFALYNLMAFSQTKEKRNAANVAIYASLFVLEGFQTHFHWSRNGDGA